MTDKFLRNFTFRFLAHWFFVQTLMFIGWDEHKHFSTLVIIEIVVNQPLFVKIKTKFVSVNRAIIFLFEYNKKISKEANFLKIFQNFFNHLIISRYKYNGNNPLIMLRDTFYKEIGKFAKELKNYPDVVDKSDPDNRDKLIKKNLRIGVSIAIKAAVKYNLDDDETDDVISQGLLGVAVAYEKYNPNKSDLRTQVLNGLRDKMTGRTFQKLLDRCNAYGTAKVFDCPLNRSYTRDELTQWLEEHIPIAKFSSVAWMWSNAYVKEEIRNILNRRSTAGELEDDVPELKQRDQEKFELLFENIGETDLYLLQLRHGLGGERPMTFRDISKRTGFQIGVIRKACETAFNAMRDNAQRHNLKIGDILP